MLKRIIIAGLLVLCGLAVGVAASAQSRSLKMGILPVLDTLPLQVAVRQGFFQKQGLNVELVPFASALERDTAMQSGALDGYFGDILNTLLLIQNKVPMRIVTVSYATAPGQRMFALVRSPKSDASETKFQVGISKSSIIEYLLDRMSSANAGKLPELEVLEVKQIPIRLQMLLAGQLGTALLPEPLASLAESKGAAILATDEELKMPLTVLCLHEERKNDVEAFLKAYTEAVESINANPETFRELMVETCRVPKPLAKTFPVYRFPEPKLPAEQDVWPVQQWMLTRGLLNAMLPYDRIVP